MKWFLHVLKNYAQFDGRARRAEYWYFILFNTIISVVLTIVDISTGMFSESMGRGLTSSIYSIAVLVPTFAVAIRRMHDVGKSGWYMLIPIYNLILAITEGEKGENQYGPDPKNFENELDLSNTLVED